MDAGVDIKKICQKESKHLLECPEFNYRSNITYFWIYLLTYLGHCITFKSPCVPFHSFDNCIIEHVN